jgi:hypothetical protein
MDLEAARLGAIEEGKKELIWGIIRWNTIWNSFIMHLVSRDYDHN